jgi:hypothetical protein
MSSNAAGYAEALIALAAPCFEAERKAIWANIGRDVAEVARLLASSKSASEGLKDQTPVSLKVNSTPAAARDESVAVVDRSEVGSDDSEHASDDECE